MEVLGLSHEQSAYGRAITAKLKESGIAVKSIFKGSNANYRSTGLDWRGISELPHTLIVKDYNDINLLRYISRKCCAVVNLDTPVLKGPILTTGHGVYSVHCAHLPLYRGNWATYNNALQNTPLIATGFIMDYGIDTGPIVNRKQIMIDNENNNIESRIEKACIRTTAELILEYLVMLHQNNVSMTYQSGADGIVLKGCRGGDGVYRPPITEAMLNLAKEKISSVSFNRMRSDYQ